MVCKTVYFRKDTILRPKQKYKNDEISSSCFIVGVDLLDYLLHAFA